MRIVHIETQATDVFYTDTLDIMEGVKFPLRRQLNMKIQFWFWINLPPKVTKSAQDILSGKIQSVKLSAFSVSKIPIFYVNWSHMDMGFHFNTLSEKNVIMMWSLYIHWFFGIFYIDMRQKIALMTSGHLKINKGTCPVLIRATWYHTMESAYKGHFFPWSLV